MTVNKSKTVEVQLDSADVLQAIKEFAMKNHPSCKKSNAAEVQVDAKFDGDGALTEDTLSAVATFTFNGKAPETK